MNELQMSDLLNTDPYVVTTSDEVFDSAGTPIGDFQALKNLVYAQDGWVRTLSLSKERSIAKPSVLGGMVFTPSFVPNADICGFGGDSYLYGLHYETGTAYIEPVFENEQLEYLLKNSMIDDGKNISLGFVIAPVEKEKKDYHWWDVRANRVSF